jgi:biotin synthase
MLQELFQLDPAALFEQAEELARPKETLFCTPIAVTTICQIEPPCRHCRWRSMSYFTWDFWRAIPRHEIIEKAQKVKQSGVQRVHMPSGCVGKRLPEHFYEYVSLVKEHAGVEVYGFFGPIEKECLALLREAGMDGYWCGLEVLNKPLFQKVRPGDDFEARLETLQHAKNLGLKTWSGFIFGIGETLADIRNGLELLRNFSVDSVSIMPFRPWPFTEMETYSPAIPYEWAKIVAITRIYLNSVDIFAFPDLAPWGIRAGANGFLPILSKLYSASDNMEKLKVMRHTSRTTLNLKGT